MGTKRLSAVTAVLAVLMWAALSGQALAYIPGKAIPGTPVYNAASGGWNYSCSFTGWRSGAKVVWKCDIVSRYIGGRPGVVVESLVQTHSGSWTPGSTSYRTPTYNKPLIVGESQLCVKASAYSVDGGTGTKYACN